MNLSNSGGTQSTLERFLPVSPDAAYAALVAAAHRHFKVRGSDDFALVIRFSSRGNLLTWGENYSAQVLRAEGGAIIRVEGVSKFNGQFEQASRIHKMADRLFEDVASAVRRP